MYQYREMLRTLISRELKSRYKGSYLGFIWTLINPLLMLLVYTVVFSFVMRSNVRNYPVYLLVCLLPWNYLITSVVQGTGCLVHNAALIRKVYFPREVIPLSVVLSALANYLLSLSILIPALLIFKIRMTEAIFAFPLVVVIETVLLIGIVFLVSIANVYFRDMEHIVSVLVTLWFYLTPIVYPLDLIPSNIRNLFYFNPATPLMDAYHKILYYGEWPDWSSLGRLSLEVVSFSMISWVIFRWFQRNIAEEI
ncbi:MAG: ABC transporter permease [Alicyclobacillus sp.]|nr:ABC transporter permease [Alicyclobacillus sp.]